MKKIVQNRFLDALFKLMILSSVIHVTIILVYSIVHLSVTKLNFFDILNVDLLFPCPSNMIVIPIFATLIMVELFLFFLLQANRE